jgi:hypothetical protein
LGWKKKNIRRVSPSTPLGFGRIEDAVHNPNLDLVNQHLPIDHAQSVFLERFFTRMTGGMRKGKS